jgi:hypothetical protein
VGATDVALSRARRAAAIACPDALNTQKSFQMLIG